MSDDSDLALPYHYLALERAVTALICCINVQYCNDLVCASNPHILIRNKLLILLQSGISIVICFTIVFIDNWVVFV